MIRFYKISVIAIALCLPLAGVVLAQEVIDAPEANVESAAEFDTQAELEQPIMPQDGVTPNEAAQTTDEAGQGDASNMTPSATPVPATPSWQKTAFNPNEYQSMVFTHWEYVAIQEALAARGSYRPPTDEELARNLKNDQNVEKVKPPPEEREIRLSGILYNNGGDWTVWLNEERITPDAIPEEVMDLKVYKSYIEFKWFDDYTNKIFPIRLRPHQRFNIDTRIFLPG